MQVMQLIMQVYASYATLCKLCKLSKQKCTKYRQRIKKLPFQRLPLEQVERGTGGDEANKTSSMTKGLICPTGWRRNSLQGSPKDKSC